MYQVYKHFWYHNQTKRVPVLSSFSSAQEDNKGTYKYVQNKQKVIWEDTRGYKDPERFHSAWAAFWRKTIDSRKWRQGESAFQTLRKASTKAQSECPL